MSLSNTTKFVLFLCVIILFVGGSNVYSYTEILKKPDLTDEQKEIATKYMYGYGALTLLSIVAAIYAYRKDGSSQVAAAPPVETQTSLLMTPVEKVDIDGSF